MHFHQIAFLSWVVSLWCLTQKESFVLSWIQSPNLFQSIMRDRPCPLNYSYASYEYSRSRNKIQTRNRNRNSNRHILLHAFQQSQDELKTLNDLDPLTHSPYITTDMNPDDDTSSSTNTLTVRASLLLPFSAPTAFSAFADLPRQPTWSHWLHSVSYIEPTTNNNNHNATIPYTQCGVPLLETKWIMKWKQITFSWTSKVTHFERPYRIRWESTSGLRNWGEIQFQSVQPTYTSETTKIHDTRSHNPQTTLMNMSLTFVTPRIVASILKRTDRISNFMEQRILLPTMINFRNVIMAEEEEEE